MFLPLPLFGCFVRERREERGKGEGERAEIFVFPAPPISLVFTLCVLALRFWRSHGGERSYLAFTLNWLAECKRSELERPRPQGHRHPFQPISLQGWSSKSRKSYILRCVSSRPFTRYFSLNNSWLLAEFGVISIACMIAVCSHIGSSGGIKVLALQNLLFWIFLENHSTKNWSQMKVFWYSAKNFRFGLFLSFTMTKGSDSWS